MNAFADLYCVAYITCGFGAKLIEDGFSPTNSPVAKLIEDGLARQTKIIVAVHCQIPSQI